MGDKSDKVVTNDETLLSSSKIEYNSPFYLGPQDRPGDFITPARLRGNNYDDWAKSIRTALRARRKFGFLDGTYTTPTPPCTNDDWWTIQSMLVSWLMNTIDPEVKSTLSHYDDAYLLWKHLKERFSDVNGPRVQQLKSNISRCEQSADMSVSTYYGKLNILWDELSHHEPILSCECGFCKCNLGTKHEKRHEDERLHQFLMGLYSPYYAQIRSTLLSQEPLPSLNRAYQQVIQEERVRGIVQKQEEKQTKPEISGFVVRTAGRGRGRGDRVDKSNLLCTHCKRSEHEIGNCFKLLGYPDWWETTYRPEEKRSTGRGKTETLGLCWSRTWCAC